MKQQNTQADHWQFSLAVYMHGNVSDHCLALQQRLGLDVNILLMMLWAARLWGCAPAPQQIEDADSMVRSWREEVILPLRKLRTRLKSGPSPAPDAMTNEFRENIKRLELDAERREQDVLAQWVREQIPDPRLSACPQDGSITGEMTTSNEMLAVLEQTAVRVIAYFEGKSANIDAAQAEAHTADPWLALQHAHEVVVAAAQVGRQGPSAC